MNIQDANRIVIGAQEIYEARCRFCHEPDLGSSSEPTVSGLTTGDPGQGTPSQSMKTQGSSHGTRIRSRRTV